jgi:hypothetical protein
MVPGKGFSIAPGIRTIHGLNILKIKIRFIVSPAGMFLCPIHLNLPSHPSHVSLPNTPESAFTSQSGSCNWKKVLFKDCGFKLHSKAEHHINAMYAWNQH